MKNDKPIIPLAKKQPKPPAPTPPPMPPSPIDFRKDREGGEDAPG